MIAALTRLAHVRSLLLVGLLVGLAACAKPPAGLPTDAVFDPFENGNRNVHEFNRTIDRSIVRPTGLGYSAFLPDDIEDMISRFAFNLSIPGSVVNSILQGNMRGATEDTYRFLVNSTIGLGGVFDVATDLKMPDATNADFGETLHVWGVREGAYLELPLLGPSTQRDTAGLIVDIILDPLNYLLDSPENYIGTVASASAGLAARGRFSDTIDSVLYESADSYAQAQSIYLQNRRFELGDGSDGAYSDPYDDPALSNFELPDAQ